MELVKEMEKREETEQELKVALGEVEAASKAKSDFLAIVSHEIRTPMNGILGMLDLVTDSELSKMQRDYLDTANRSAETLLRLLNDLLDFSKSNQGGLKLERTAFLFKETVEEITSLMAGRAKKKGLKLSFSWDDNAPDWVSGDPIRFRQIIGNLLGNAVKFTEEGEVSVSLTHLEREDELIRYHFEIMDTGIGIDPEAMETLFEPFTQADLFMTRKYGGTGVGLGVSKELIELMDGCIDVSSEVQGGSKFSFNIVLGEPACDSPAS
ncbi:ATP-binding protein [Opitutales bacterium]|nr:ATP-binding protein [Opitutales bacterium]